MKTYFRENSKLLFAKGQTWLVTEMLSPRISHNLLKCTYVWLQGPEYSCLVPGCLPAAAVAKTPAEAWAVWQIWLSLYGSINLFCICYCNFRLIFDPFALSVFTYTALSFQTVVFHWGMSRALGCLLKCSTCWDKAAGKGRESHMSKWFCSRSCQGCTVTLQSLKQ